MQRKATVIVGGLVLVMVSLLFTVQTHAIAAFARKYNVKCFTCHTIFPRLNKTGYMFKRLGYRMPPDLEEGKDMPKISELDNKIPWKLDNSVALLIATSVTNEKERVGDERTSSNSINLDEAALLFGGSVPESNFSYFGEYLLYEDGETELEKAKVDYTVGNVGSSLFMGIGKASLQEGFKASSTAGLVEEDSPVALDVSSLNNFSLGKHPALLEFGYTWASMYYKQVLGLTVKVANSLDEDGGSVTSGSSYNHKDIWFQADYLFGPDGGVSLMTYRGKKPQVQNEYTPDEFLYFPYTHRNGLFANYLFFNKLDILGGYLWSKEDWRDFSVNPIETIKSHSYFGEIDYYIKTGIAVFGRYDKTRDTIKDNPMFEPMNGKSYLIGAVATLVAKGNIKSSITYGHSTQTDMFGESTKASNFKLSLVLGW